LVGLLSTNVAVSPLGTTSMTSFERLGPVRKFTFAVAVSVEPTATSPLTDWGLRPPLSSTATSV